MKKLSIVLSVILSLSLLAACGNGDGSDEAVVKTKSGNVTQGEFYDELKETSGSQVLQELVYEKLLEDKYSVSDNDVKKKYDEIKKTFSDEDQFNSYLTQNNLTDKKFKRQIKNYLMMTKAQRDGIKVTDKDLQNYYNKNKDDLIELKASHILVADEKTAKSIQQKLKDGEDFAKLAKEKSTDTGSKDKGGELGWFKQSTMVAEFSEAAKKLKVGEISGPVKSENGYHIIKLEGKKESFDDLKESTKEAYLTSKQKSQEEVIQKLVKDADVKVQDDDFKDLFSTTSTGTSTQTQQ